MSLPIYMHTDPDLEMTFYWRENDDRAYEVRLTDDHTWIIVKGYREDTNLPCNRFNFSHDKFICELEYTAEGGIASYINFLLTFEK